MNRLLTFAVVLSGSILAGPPAGASLPCLPIGSTYTLYMSNNGNDSNSGCSTSSAMKTLEAVEAKLKTMNPQGDVYIRIDPNSGPYNIAQTVTWTYYNSQFPTYFLPYSWNVSAWQNSRYTLGRPTFRGNDSVCGYFLWFKPTIAADTQTNLNFIGLQIEHFARGGIAISGTKAGDETFHHVSGNTFDNLTLKQIGTKHHTKGYMGLGAISFVYASGNTVRYTQFSQIENTPSRTTAARNQCPEERDTPPKNPTDGASHIHSLYIQHHSEANTVTRTEHTAVSGDPIRFRDGSDDNTVSYNSFANSGVKAPISDWLNDESNKCRIGGGALSDGECPSTGNSFRWNATGSMYGGGDGKLRCVHHYDDRTNVPNAQNDGCWNDWAYGGYPNSSHRISTANNNAPGSGSGW